MPAKKSDTIYRVYYSKGRDKDAPVYEIHARSVGQSDMLGFIEVSDFVSPKRDSKIIRPDTDRTEREFADVTRTFIPLTDIRRIDAIPSNQIKVEAGPLKVVELKTIN